MKKIGHITLEQDERLAMEDSGSFVHAIDDEEKLPGHNIEPVQNRGKERTAETACGGILNFLGHIRTQGTIEGKNPPINWRHKKVKVQI